MPITELVTAASDVGAMGDKVAAFAIAQNLVWVLASLKGDFGDWLRSSNVYFIRGSCVAGVIYALFEGCLGWHASNLIWAAHYDADILPHVLNTSRLLFWMRALGAAGSSAIAGLAFWGTTRPVDTVPAKTPE